MQSTRAMRLGLLLVFGLSLCPGSRSAAQITKVRSRYGQTQVLIPDPLFRVTVYETGQVVATNFTIRVDHIDSLVPCHKVFSVHVRFNNDVRRGVTALVPSAGNRTGPCNFDFGDVAYPEFNLSYPAAASGAAAVGGSFAGSTDTPYIAAEKAEYIRSCGGPPIDARRQLAPYYPITVVLSYVGELRLPNVPGPPDVVVDGGPTRIEFICSAEPFHSAGGSAGGSVTANDRTLPQLLSFTVAPDTLPPAGGTVTITVKASDNTSVSAVTMLYVRPDGTQSGLRLPLTGGNAANGVWMTSWSVPTNVDAAARVYTMKVTVSDNDANVVASSARTITVAARGQASPKIALPGKKP